MAQRQGRQGRINYLLYLCKKINLKVMPPYKFSTRISKDGVITLPFEPYLFNREVEITIVPKQKSTAGTVPDGYMSLEEFREQSKASLIKILNEHGMD
jgi:hypothetical protein